MLPSAKQSLASSRITWAEATISQTTFIIHMCCG